MNILVLTTMVPFVHGGAEELRNHLVANLRLAGMTAEAIALPFSWDPPERLITEMLIARSVKLTNVDRVIALKFPAYLVEHPNKVVWLLHQYRQAYDLRDAGQSNIANTARGAKITGAIRAADGEALRHVRHLYTNSNVTAARLRYYNGIEGTILPPPLNDPELFIGGASQGYILASGRINAGKRQHLLLEALAEAPRVQMIIAGPPDTPADAERLRLLLERHNLQDRVRLELGFLARDRLAALVCGAQAVAYLPFDEDSPGYVTMEAFQAQKPVLTVTDSGGVLEFVVDGQTGWVCSPEALAPALVQAFDDPALCRNMGQAAYASLIARELTWPATIERLLAP